MKLYLFIFIAMTGVLISSGCDSKDQPQENLSSFPASPDQREKLPSLAEQLNLLRKEVDDAEAAYESAQGEERKQAWKTYIATADKIMPQVVELVRKDPKTATAFEALEWVVIDGRQAAWKEWGVQAIQFLLEHHAENPQVDRLCATLGNLGWHYDRHEPVLDFLRIAAKKNPARSVRGLATLALATQLHYRAKNLQNQKKGDPKPLFDEAEKLFEAVLSDYADLKILWGTDLYLSWDDKKTLGDLAKNTLFEIRHLAIGKVAPEIDGEDIDGGVFKLSDYRGKVVVLNFWGDW